MCFRSVSTAPGSKATIREPLSVPLLPLVGLIAIEFVLLFFITSRDTSTWAAVGVFWEGDPIALLGTMGRSLLLLLSRLPTTAHWLPMPVYEWHSWELFVGVAVLAGLALLVWSKRPASVWSGWVLLSVVPFVLINDPILFERPWAFSRYLYMATVGSSVLLAWGLDLVARRFRYGTRYLYPGSPGGHLHQQLLQSEAVRSHFVVLLRKESLGEGRLEDGCWSS